MFRFFVDEKIDNFFPLSSNNLKHIKVARIENEEFIIVYKEKFYKCILGKEGNRAIIKEEIIENHEFEEEVILAASIINTKRFEWLVQKATELGATKLIPVLSKNRSQKIGSDIQKKVSRWNQIARSAAEQSFRNKQMIVSEPLLFKDVLNLSIENKFIAHEKVDAKVINSFPQNSLFLVGPEGGFTKDEVEDATKKGFETISLGKRILRAETASLFILSRVL